jgi:hypothetical protein
MLRSKQSKGVDIGFFNLHSSREELNFRRCQFFPSGTIIKQNRSKVSAGSGEEEKSKSDILWSFDNERFIEARHRRRPSTGVY